MQQSNFFFMSECLPHRCDRYYLASWIDSTNSENNPLCAQVENVLSQYSKDLLIKIKHKVFGSFATSLAT